MSFNLSLSNAMSTLGLVLSLAVTSCERRNDPQTSPVLGTRPAIQTVEITARVVGLTVSGLTEVRVSVFNGTNHVVYLPEGGEKRLHLVAIEQKKADSDWTRMGWGSELPALSAFALEPNRMHTESFHFPPSYPPGWLAGNREDILLSGTHRISLVYFDSEKAWKGHVGETYEFSKHAPGKFRRSAEFEPIRIFSNEFQLPGQREVEPPPKPSSQGM